MAHKAWIVENAEGGCDDLSPMRAVMASSSTVLRKLLVTLGMWSAVRLEQQVEEVRKIFACVSDGIAIGICAVSREVWEVLRSFGLPSTARVVFQAEVRQAEIGDATHGGEPPTSDGGEPAAPAEESPAGDAVPVARSSSKVLEVSHLTAMSKAIERKVQHTYHDLKVLAAQYESVVLEFIKQTPVELDVGGRDGSVMHEACTGNIDFFGEVCKYMELCCELSATATSSIGSGTGEVDTSAAAGNVEPSAQYIDSLSSFCAMHKTIVEGKALQFSNPPLQAWAHKLHAVFAFDQTFDELLHLFGAQIYDAHANQAVDNMLCRLDGFFVELHAVGAVGNTGTDAASVQLTAEVRKVLKSPMFEVLLEQVEEVKALDLSGDVPSVRLAFAGLSHNKVLAQLVQLTGAIGLGQLPFADAVEVASGNTEVFMPKDSVFEVAETYLLIRDICLISCIVGPMLDKEAADIQPEYLTSTLTDFCFALGLALKSLEERLLKSDLTAVDQQWQLPTSLEVCKLWRRALSIFSGKCQRKLLSMCCVHVDAMTRELQGATPAWNACFTGDQCNLEMVAQLFRGKLSGMAKANNQLHRYLSLMGSSADRLQTTPKLKVNEVTAQVVQVALHALGQAGLAGAVNGAVRVLLDFQYTTAGPMEAEKFLKQTAPEQISALPSSLLARVRSLAGDVAALTDEAGPERPLASDGAGGPKSAAMVSAGASASGGGDRREPSGAPDASSVAESAATTRQVKRQKL